MNKFKIWATGLALLACGSRAFAQNETDAIRYSMLGFGGTARMQGIAGAQTALGPDASNMAGNPAGLGFYRKSEFTFSPGFNFNNTDSFLGTSSTPDSRNNFNIPQIGVVFTNRKADEVVSDWRSGSFGFGFTRLNSLQANTSYTGTVADNKSFLQSLDDNIRNFNLTKAQLDLEYGTGGNNITTLEGLAYATYLIDVDSATGALYVPARQGAITQSESIESRGAQNQFDFSYGASYKDKLFIGGSIGIATINYKQTRSYTETTTNDEPYFSSLTLNDYFETSGAGINFKLGLIYKPTDAFRMGATIQTPTFYGLSDDYSSSMRANYKPGVFNTTSISAQTLGGTFEYNLTTPFRANGGLGYLFNKYGFISADVEYVGYGGARFSISDDNPYGIDPGTGYFSQQNRIIANTYNGAVNYRIGAEGRFDIFRVRAGYAHYGDPYKNSTLDRGRNYYTVGIGLKEERYFIDAAYVHSAWNSYYSPYKLNDNSQPVVKIENTNVNFVITTGFNF